MKRKTKISKTVPAESSTAEKVREYLVENEIEALTADGFDKAIIGLGYRFNTTVVAYDYDKCIKILKADMTEEEAEEFLSFNTIGAWVGEGTPVFVKRF